MRFFNRRFFARNLKLIVFSSIFAIVFVSSIYLKYLTDFSYRTMEHSIEQRLMFVAKQAAQLTSAEELERYQTAADMELPEYKELRGKLLAFSRAVEVKYIYYLRSVGGRLWRFIIDNDYDETSRVGLDSPVYSLDTDPWIQNALNGETVSCGIGNYTLAGQAGLLTVYSPVFNADGAVVAVVGVDIDDTEIFRARRLMSWFTIMQIVSVVLIFSAGLFALLRLRVVTDRGRLSVNEGALPKNSIRRKFFIFSLIFLVIIIIGSSTIFYLAMYSLSRKRMEQVLTLALETMRLRLANLMNTEVSLAVKMADDPVIWRYMVNPDDGQQSQTMIDKVLDSYRRNFKNKSIFWISDRDKIFHIEDKAYPLDPETPSEHWYEMTMTHPETYNFVVDYNTESQKIFLWVNVPVFDQDLPPEPAPAVGVVGNGAEITTFIHNLYRELPAGVELFAFNQAKEIVIARDQDLIINRSDTATNFGSVNEVIIEKFKQLRENDVEIFNYDGRKYALGLFQLMNWSIVASIPLSYRQMFDPNMSSIFLLMLTLIIVIFYISNQFIGFIQATVNEQQRNLIRLKEQAETAGRAKSKFLASMSHEIRTPINAVVGMNQIARNSVDLNRIYDCLDKSQLAARQLLNLINDILDMSKIDAKKFELVDEPFNLPLAIRNASSIVEARAAEKKQNFMVDVAADLPPVVIGDELRLSQIILNLLSNAIKFTPAGGAIVLAAKLLNTQNSQAEIEISCRDTGIGITIEQKSRLFNAFVQAESSVVKRFGGTGLGLAISKNLAEMMHGGISVDSVPGDGSCFTVKLQLAVGEASLLAAKSYENTPEVFDFTGRSLLLVEDLDINREIIISLLENTGVKIDCAENGLCAVEMFKAAPSKYDLIFMDVLMPVMDGYESTRQIRKFEQELITDKAVGSATAHRHVPIVAMTASAFLEDVENCRLAGMDGHLAKPIEIDDLLSVTNQYLRNT